MIYVYIKLTCSINRGTQTEYHQQGGDCCRSGDNSETRHSEYHKLDLLSARKVVSAVKLVYSAHAPAAAFRCCAPAKTATCEINHVQHVSRAQSLCTKKKNRVG